MIVTPERVSSIYLFVALLMEIKKSKVHQYKTYSEE